MSFCHSEFCNCVSPICIGSPVEDVVLHTVSDPGQAMSPPLDPMLRAWAARVLPWTAALRGPVGMPLPACVVRNGMWICLLHNVKVTTEWEGENNLSMDGICTVCYKKIHPWSILHFANMWASQDLLSICSPLYSLLIKQIFYNTVCCLAFLTEILNKLCTTLPLPTHTLPSRTEDHPNCPSSNI